MTTIQRIYVGTTEFEGVEYTRARAIMHDGTELTIADEIEDLRALGSMDKVKESLRLHEGKFGPYLRLSRYKHSEDLF